MKLGARSAAGRGGRFLSVPLGGVSRAERGGRGSPGLHGAAGIGRGEERSRKWLEFQAGGSDQGEGEEAAAARRQEGSRVDKALELAAGIAARPPRRALPPRDLALRVSPRLALPPAPLPAQARGGRREPRAPPGPHAERGGHAAALPRGALPSRPGGGGRGVARSRVRAGKRRPNFPSEPWGIPAPRPGPARSPPPPAAPAPPPVRGAPRPPGGDARTQRVAGSREPW